MLNSGPAPTNKTKKNTKNMAMYVCRKIFIQVTAFLISTAIIALILCTSGLIVVVFNHYFLIDTLVSLMIAHRQKDLKQQRCGYIDKCRKYHGQSMQTTRKS